MEYQKMLVQQIEIGPMMNFVYLIGCRETGEAAIIDPAWDAKAILRKAEESNLEIKHVLLTHGHPDHMNAAGPLLKATGARLYIHTDEVNYMREVMHMQSSGTSTELWDDLSGSLQRVFDGYKIHVGKLLIECLHTPGHTPGSQCFLVEDCLFSGDTLFVDACGRVDMPGGEAEQMWWSLNQKLRSLPDHIVIYPGHDYGGSPTSTIGQQKRSNPYMNYDSVRKFVRDMNYI